MPPLFVNLPGAATLPTRLVADELLTALTRAAPPRSRNRFQLIAALTDLLSGPRRLVVIDEAQRLGSSPAPREAAGACEVHDRYSAGTYPAPVRHRASWRLTDLERASEGGTIGEGTVGHIPYCLGRRATQEYLTATAPFVRLV
jgi:hypothetical protein